MNIGLDSLDASGVLTVRLTSHEDPYCISTTTHIPNGTSGSCKQPGGVTCGCIFVSIVRIRDSAVRAVRE